MKIVYFFPSLDPTDGYNRYALDIVSRISKEHEVVAICAKKSEMLSGIRQHPILKPPHHYFLNPLRVLIDSFRVQKILKKEFAGCNDAIVHFMAEGYAMTLPFLWGLRFKSVVTIHGTYSVLPLKRVISHWFYRHSYILVDRIVSVSNFTKRHLLRNAPFLNPQKIIVMTNGVDYIDHVMHEKTGKISILSVGQVKFRKGMHNLVEVGRILKQRGRIDFQIVFVGDCTSDALYVAELHKKIREYHMESDVLFAGKVSETEKSKFYDEARIFALLSEHKDFHYEGYPLVFHEAAMWGLPTIGSTNSGAEDAIKQGISGFVLDPHEYEKIATIIESVVLQNAIHPEDCKKWAQENDWSRKDLSAMYASL